MKFGFVDEHRGLWPVRMICAAVGLSVSGYYAWRARTESRRAVANRALLEDIRWIHAESSGTYGSPRVHAALRHRGRRIGRSRIERLMRHAGLRGLAALPRRTRTTDSRHTYPIAPNRLGRKKTSLRADPARSGSPTLPTFPPARAGSILPPCSICTRARSSAGQCASASTPRSHWRRSTWQSSGSGRRRD